MDSEVVTTNSLRDEIKYDNLLFHMGIYFILAKLHLKPTIDGL